MRKALKFRDFGFKLAVINKLMYEDGILTPQLEAEAYIDKVIEQFYTDDASIQENQNEPRVGKGNLIENEQKMLKKALTVNSTCIRPIFQLGNNVVIRWNFRFVWKDNSITEIEELAYQEWEGDKIKREQFFYDPKQFIPKS